METTTRTWLFTVAVHANRGGVHQGLLLPVSVRRLIELAELVAISPGTDPRGTPGRGRYVSLQAWKSTAEPVARWFPQSAAHHTTRIVDLPRGHLPGEAIEVVRKLRPSCSWQYQPPDEDGPFHTENFSPDLLGHHLFGVVRSPADLAVVFDHLADRRPDLLARVLTPTPGGMSSRTLAARQALRQRFPDGVPTEVVSRLLSHEHRGLREAAILHLPTSVPRAPHRIR